MLDFACGWGSLLLNGRRQVGKAGGGCLAEVDSDSLHNEGLAAWSRFEFFNNSVKPLNRDGWKHDKELLRCATETFKEARNHS